MARPLSLLGACALTILGALSLAGCAPASVAERPQASQGVVPAAPAAVVPALPPPPPMVELPPVAAPRESVTVDPGALPGADAATGPTIQGEARAAILLPLSGASAGIGQVLQSAAELAVFDFADDRFVLRPYDTEVAGAAAAAERAIADGAQVILGPIFARQVPEVAAIARLRGINVLSFSNDRTIAGDGVYIMGLPPGQSVARVVEHAASAGIARYGVLLPSEPYGERIGEALREAVAARGGTITRSEYYDPGTVDFSSVVRRVAEFDRRRVAPTGSLARRGQPSAAGDPDYQAIVLADGGQRLRLLAPMLPYYDIDTSRIRVIGTPLFEEPGLGAEPALQGAWYAAPDPAQRAEFEQKYRDAFGTPPHRLATLAYDAVGLAAVLARVGPVPDYSATMLTNPDGFAGADGIFRFGPNGVIERGLAVLQIQRNGFTVVSPAPTRFDPPLTN